MSMNFENVEVTTKSKCATCGDSLMAWEIRLCILCEVDED